MCILSTLYSFHKHIYKYTNTQEKIKKADTKLLTAECGKGLGEGDQKRVGIIYDFTFFSKQI